MVCTSDPKIYEKLKMLRSWGRASSLISDSENFNNRFDVSIDHIKYDKKFIFSEIGYNLEPSEISAAFCNVQFSKLEAFKKKRRHIYNQHINFLKNFPSIFILPSEVPLAEVVWYAFPIILTKDSGINRNELQIFLEKRNIQTRPVFAGNISRQPGYRNQKMIINDNLLNADYIMENALVIGCHQGMSNQQVEWVHASLKDFLKNY